MSFKNNDGTIPKGLRIDIMRQCMENTSLLTSNENGINTYMGTGWVIEAGEEDIAVTKAVDIKDGYFKCHGGSTPGVSQGGVQDNNFDPRVYELVVNTALNSDATQQFSSMKGAKGIIGASPNIGEWGKIINPFGQDILISVGLLRFQNLYYCQVESVQDSRSFSSNYVYFIPYYRGTSRAKILTTKGELQSALEQGFEVYKMEDYDEGALYLMNSPTVNCDYTVLESYSRDSFVQEIIENSLYPSFNKLIRFSSGRNINYFPMGYTQVVENIGTKTRFEYIKSTLENPAETTASNKYYQGYTESYVIEGKTVASTVYNFTKIQKYFSDNPTVGYDLVASSQSSAHYMILYKIIENPTS